MTETDPAPLEPRRAWWARPRKLVVLERPGGGGRSHRAERRAREVAWLRARGVHTVVSVMATRHGLTGYEDAGLAWHHVPAPVTAQAEEALEEVVDLLAQELRRSGAVAVHGNLHTDFVAAVGAAYLHRERGIDPVVGLAKAAGRGLTLTPEACALAGADHAEVLAALERFSVAA